MKLGELTYTGKIGQLHPFLSVSVYRHFGSETPLMDMGRYIIWIQCEMKYNSKTTNNAMFYILYCHPHERVRYASSAMPSIPKIDSLGFTLSVV